jgi:hypothetical protein
MQECERTSEEVKCRAECGEEEICADEFWTWDGCVCGRPWGCELKTKGPLAPLSLAARCASLNPA